MKAPLWRFELEIAATILESRRCFELREVPWDELSADQRSYDKVMSLCVRCTPRGYELACREFDVYLRRWGPVERREVLQVAHLQEACFDLLLATHAPLATIEPIADNDEEVMLAFRGGALPRRPEASPFAVAGDLFQPMLRRTDRTGELLKNGILSVPWTFLTASEQSAAEAESDAGKGSSIWRAQIHTGMRRPFGVQRRGFVHQVAIGLRSRPVPTQVRFHARSDAQQGLAGYEVFRTSAGGRSELIGTTNAAGVIAVPPGEGPVSMVLLRSDGQLLAKVPVPAGLPEVMQAPIADSVSRLRAQAESRVVREELIDIVARRAIMMTRTRSLLKKGRVADARKLMMELDELPTSATFGRNIEQAAKRIPAANDPAVQKRIDALFSSTRELLSKFLSTRPITDLQREVNDAAARSRPATGG
ncbi:MAG: hypothetical protein DCC67_13020 [Planctomycetota bacterium]|nr:MAG: hypothetical protein DCC67_13020 [Planctomycetota bacterium]